MTESGTSGAGKTRSIVTPNLLQAEGSYVVSDPKRDLYKKYGGYLKNQGYIVKKLDFTDPENSAHYNFFRYIRNTQDIVKIAHMLIYQKKGGGHADPFWDEASQLLVQAIISYLREEWSIKEQNLHQLLELISLCEIDENSPDNKNPLDRVIDALEKKNKDSYAVNSYKKFRVAAGVISCRRFLNRNNLQQVVYIQKSLIGKYGD